jgi:hypothetical protein
VVRVHIIGEKFKECEDLLKVKYNELYEEKEIKKLFSVYKFLSVVKSLDSLKALEYALASLVSYKGQTVTMLDENGVVAQIPMEVRW